LQNQGSRPIVRRPATTRRVRARRAASRRTSRSRCSASGRPTIRHRWSSRRTRWR
jgi:hypothetical protein